MDVTERATPGIEVRLVVLVRAQVDIQNVYIGVLPCDGGERLVDDAPSGHVVVVDVLAGEDLQTGQLGAGADAADQVAEDPFVANGFRPGVRFSLIPIKAGHADLGIPLGELGERPRNGAHEEIEKLSADIRIPIRMKILAAARHLDYVDVVVGKLPVQAICGRQFDAVTVFAFPRSLRRERGLVGLRLRRGRNALEVSVVHRDITVRVRLVGHRHTAVLPGDLGVGGPEVLVAARLAVRDRERGRAARVRLPRDQKHNRRPLCVRRAVGPLLRLALGKHQLRGDPVGDGGVGLAAEARPIGRPGPQLHIHSIPAAVDVDQHSARVFLAEFLLGRHDRPPGGLNLVEHLLGHEDREGR